ncbi:ABC transporter substrate-binding protein [Halobacteriales archaeon Cl-PHB]
MTAGRSERAGTLTRRHLLAAGAGAATVATSGCLQRVRSLVGRPTNDQVSLTIKTMPDDADATAIRIARALADSLEQVGVETDITLMPRQELRRDILTRGKFDLYVDQCPTATDPDYLRPLLGSRFKGEPGWQNPFAFTNLEVDELLTRQRTTSGATRRQAVDAIQHEVARLQPFTIVAVPEGVSAVRADRFTGWNAFGLSSPLNYVALDRTDGSGPAGKLRVTITDARLTENLNPMAVEFRDRGTFTGLLYDPLGRWIDGAVRPWAAESWKFQDGDETVATVTLRDGQSWHDGTALSAADATFTYEFMSDTTLGDDGPAVPAPRFRGRSSLVKSASMLDDRTLRLRFGETTPEVARRALTVPILPRHEWEPRTDEADIAGVDVNNRVTEALVWANTEPVGSGPLRFERLVQEEALVLSRNDDHFLHSESASDLTEYVGDGVPYRELSVRVVPSDAAAVELLAADQADATASSTNPKVVPRIGRNESLNLLVDQSPSFYHVGFNTRRDPLGNPHFRRTVSRLVDKGGLVSEVFKGYGEPAASPLAGTAWVAPGLEWEGQDPKLPFLGSNGELNVEAARDLLREAGFRYDDRDRLLHQQ